MARDLLFRRFVGIRLSQTVPDHSTRLRFRNKPAVQALQEINVFEDGFIKATDFTAGNVHDSECFTELLSCTESQVYPGSAYASKKPITGQAVIGQSTINDEFLRELAIYGNFNNGVLGANLWRY